VPEFKRPAKKNLGGHHFLGIWLMGFRSYSHMVSNPKFPLWYRLSILRKCISYLIQLTGETYPGCVQRLDARFGFDRPEGVTELPEATQLLDTLDAITKERNLILEQRRREAMRCLRAKLRRRHSRSKTIRTLK
jgi:hypothetical protein